MTSGSEPSVSGAMLCSAVVQPLKTSSSAPSSSLSSSGCSLSSASSPTSPHSTSSPSPCSPHLLSFPLPSHSSIVSHSYFISDEELAQLSVRQLNKRLQGHGREVVASLKQRRRILKNRGYALNCRVRRINNQLQLETDNIQLREQVLHLRGAVAELQNRLAYFDPASASAIAASMLLPPHHLKLTRSSTESEQSFQMSPLPPLSHPLPPPPLHYTQSTPFMSPQAHPLMSFDVSAFAMPLE